MHHAGLVVAHASVLTEGIAEHANVVFPAGGVATAERPFGRAEELPWKAFTARLIQQAQASVLPVYFEGQNSPLFHLISRYSVMLRLSLLVSEFRRVVDQATENCKAAPPPSLSSPPTNVGTASDTAATASLYSCEKRSK